MRSIKSPKDVRERLERFLGAWRQLAHEKSFGGMTLTDFERETLASITSRELVNEFQLKLRQALATRDAADEVTLEKMQFVVASVIGDPTEGPDSALYQGLGYTPRRDYKTGLTRKRTAPAQP